MIEINPFTATLFTDLVQQCEKSAPKLTGSISPPPAADVIRW